MLVVQKIESLVGKAENFASQKAADRGSTFSSQPDQNLPALDTKIERAGGEDEGAAGFWNGTRAFPSLPYSADEHRPAAGCWPVSLPAQLISNPPLS